MRIKLWLIVGYYLIALELIFSVGCTRMINGPGKYQNTDGDNGGTFDSGLGGGPSDGSVLVDDVWRPPSLDATISCQNNSECPQYTYCHSSVCVPGCEPGAASGAPGSCNYLCLDRPQVCRADNTCLCFEGEQPGTMIEGGGGLDLVGCLSKSTSYCLDADLMDSAAPEATWDGSKWIIGSSSASYLIETTIMK